MDPRVLLFAGGKPHIEAAGLILTEDGAWSTAATLTGTLFTKAPTFPQGVVTGGTVSLTGTLFTKTATFPTGTVSTDSVALTGTLFTKAPTFPVGVVSLAGSLFARTYVGTDAVGSSALALSSTKMYVKKVSLTADTILATIDAYLHTTDGEQVSVRPVVYTDNAGAPDLMLVGPQFDFNSIEFNGVDRWVKLPVGLHIPANADYWIGVHAPDPGSLTIAYETTGGNDQQINSGSTWTIEPGAVGGSITDPGDHLYSIRGSVVSPVTKSFVGRTTVGGSDLALSTDVIYLKKVTISAGGTLATVDAHLKVSVASVPSVVAVVMSDDSNAPDRFLHVGHGTPDGWLLENTYRWFSFPVGLQFTVETDVWIGVLEDNAGTIALAYDTTGGADGTLAGRSEAGTWTAGTQNYSIRGTVIDETLAAGRYGVSSFGASEQTPDSSIMYAVPVTLPAEGFAVGIEAGIRDVAGTTTWVNNAALYADDGGAPGDLIASFGASNTAYVFVTSESDRWYGFPIFEFLAAGDYWIGFQNGIGQGALLYDTGTTGDGYEIDAQTANVIPEPGSSGTTLNDTDRQYSLRLVVLTEAGGTQSLTGTLFTKTPTFSTGTITTGPVTLTGTLFVKTPTFPVGVVSLAGSTQNLTGTLFTTVPTFSVGVVSLGAGGTQNLTGVLFTKAPTFFLGTVVEGEGEFPIIPTPAVPGSSIRIEVWSLPDDPGGFRLLCEPPFLNGTSFQDRADVYGGGQLIVPADYEHLALIVDVDPSAIETSHSSIIRGLQFWPTDESGFDGEWHVIWEFFADEAEEQISRDGQRVVTITGLDVRAAPDDGIVYPRQPTSPNWEWGAPTLLENPGFEDSALSSAGFQLSINATAGTFTIDIDGETTGPLDWDTDAPTVAIALEALTSITDVVISGDGTPTNPFIIEFLDPSNTDIGTVSTDSGGLTGLASVQIITVGGASLPLPWTRSFNPATGLYHGTYNSFAVSTVQAHIGSYSLKVDADLGDWPGSFPGAQQIVSVGEGEHWASVWVYPTVTARYRFGIRTLDDTWLDQVEAVLTAGSWQELTIPTLNFPPYVAQVIFRVACISNNHGDAIFYIDDAILAPGFPATTWGDILSVLMNAAFTRGTLDWLELGFDATIDSDGVTWDTDEFAFQADALMKLGTHVIGDGEAAGYEHDLVAIDPPGVTTHILHAYNPLGRGDVSVQAAVVGAFNAGRVAKRRVPYTHLLLELNDGTHVEVADARLTGFGRRERGVRVEQATDVPTAQKIGQAIFDKEIPNLLAAQITLSGHSVLPYRDFDIGWIVSHTFAHRALKHNRRVQVITSAYSESRWMYVVTSAGVEVES